MDRKKKAGEADNTESRQGVNRPPSQIELVGVYKYTRAQQKARLQTATDSSP